MKAPPHQQELESLRQLRAEVTEGKTGRAAILIGPGGTAGAELLTQWRQELHRQREPVFEADCYPGGSAYAPLVEVMARYVRVVENLGLMDAALGQLYSQVGKDLGVVRLVSAERGPAGPRREGDELRFYERLGELFSRLSEKVSGVILIRDLHLADAATRAAVQYLLRFVVTDPFSGVSQAPSGSVSFVGLFAVSLAEGEPLLANLREHLDGRQGVRFIDLTDATEESVRRFLSSPEVIQRFLDSTGGDAIHLESLVESLPHNVEDLYLRRCEQLSSQEREVLEGLAVCGKPIAPDLLLLLLGLESCAVILNDLIQKRVIVRRVQRGQLLIDLPSQGNRQVIYHRLDPARRARLHGRYAGILRQRARFGDSPDVAELARHYLRGEHPQEAIETSLLAAERLHMTFAYEQAIELLEAALPLTAGGKDRQAVLERLVDLYGCRHEHRRALYYCGLLKKEVRPTDRGVLFRRTAEFLLQLGSYRSALRLLEKAEQAFESTGDAADRQEERIRIAAIAAEALYGLGQHDRVVRECQAGLGRVLGSTQAEVLRQAIRLNNTLGKVYLQQEEYDRAIAVFRQNLEQAQEQGWSEEAVRARFNLGTVALSQRDYERAEELLSSCLVSDEGEVSPVIRAFIQMNLAVAYHKTNRYARALDSYLLSLSTFSRSGNELQYAVAAMNLGALYELLGDLGRARELVGHSLKIMQARGMRYYEGWASYVLGSIALEEGQLGEARACLAHALQVMSQQGSETWVQRIQVRLCRLDLQAGEVAGCRARLSALVQAGTTREEREIEAEAHQSLGQALIASGQTEAGLSELMRARNLAEEVEAQDRLWRIDLRLAEQYQRDGRSGEAIARLQAAASLIHKVAEQLPPGVESVFLGTPERQRVFQLLEEIRSSRHRPAPITKQMALPQGRDFAVWRKRYGRMVGDDRKLLQIFRMIDRIADSGSTVLIQGESGTGKELIAEAIHNNSSRRDQPFVKVNCAAFVETLLLSELFGHEKGAFTGALSRKKGRFELADGGTLFLDEIGDISQNTQIALLRVLQERTFERVGGGEPIAVNVRVIVATNQAIEEMVKRGEFRLDLYYRLKGVIVELPPLRSRRGDIAPLLNHFTALCQPAGQGKRFSFEALEYLTRYSWPGNVRELENFARSISLFVDEPVIDLHHILQFEEFFDDGERIEELPEDLLAGLREASRSPEGCRMEQVWSAQPSEPPHPDEPVPIGAQDGGSVGSAMMVWARNEGLGLPELRRWIELEYIKRALAETGGNVTQAAKLLDMKRPRLSQIINGTAELSELRDKLTSTGEEGT
ncbi:MAG: sigma 54-interacting transcriptional regulator [Bradymonadales bacterium]|nr:sigma 54-interacting transcriptional regulator [Bradymonadales bacterium]